MDMQASLWRADFLFVCFLSLLGIVPGVVYTLVLFLGLWDTSTPISIVAALVYITIPGVCEFLSPHILISACRHLFSFYLCVVCVCTGACMHVRVCVQRSWRGQESRGPSGAGTKDSCEWYHIDADSQTWVLCRSKQTLLTAEPALQPESFFSWW